MITVSNKAGFGSALLAVAALLGSNSFANAAPTINGVNLTGFDSVQTVQFTVQGSSTNVGAGKLYLSLDPAGNVYFALVQPITLNNNAYGTTAIMNGSGGAAPFNWTHNLSDLTGSDLAQFQFFNKASSTVPVFDFKFDYLSLSGSNYVTLGATGGDGSVASGSAGWLLQYATSASYDLSHFPSYTTNSPTPAQQPTWVNEIIYEGEIAAAAFGASGFGGVKIPVIHDSPADHQPGGTNKFAACTTLCTPGTPTRVPEPSSLIQMLAGLAGLQIAFFFKRSRRKTSDAGALVAA